MTQSTVYGVGLAVLLALVLIGCTTTVYEYWGQNAVETCDLTADRSTWEFCVVEYEEGFEACDLTADRSTWDNCIVEYGEGFEACDLTADRSTWDNCIVVREARHEGEEHAKNRPDNATSEERVDVAGK